MTLDKFTFYLNRDGWPLTDSVGFSPGKTLNCPVCNSTKISIFFKPGFIGKDIGRWCDFIQENDFDLSDSFDIINEKNFNPTWICKDCYNGGVVVEK